jgi:hypothetical protein
MCDHMINKCKINLLPPQWCNHQLKMRNKYIKTMAWNKRERKHKKEGRNKEYHKHVQPKFAPTFKEIV